MLVTKIKSRINVFNENLVVFSKNYKHFNVLSESVLMFISLIIATAIMCTFGSNLLNAVFNSIKLLN